MDSFHDVIPHPLFDAIERHISSNCSGWTARSWNSARAEEDTLTGDFLGRFEKPSTISDAYPDWQWDMTYKKIRGRGPKAPESVTGADGIFDVTVKDSSGKTLFQKAFLFQAKMAKSFSPATTLPQAMAMEKISKDCSVVVVFEEHAYKVIRSKDYIDNHQDKSYSTMDFCDFIVNDFFKCKHGTRDMSFNIDSENLTIKGAIKARRSQKDLNVLELNINENK